MTQLALGLDLHLRTPARRMDPSTSHDAARALVDSGRLTEQMAATLHALGRWHTATDVWPTSAELAGDDVDLRYQHARRLADLRHVGRVQNGEKRRCRVTGRMALTWGAITWR